MQLTLLLSRWLVTPLVTIACCELVKTSSTTCIFLQPCCLRVRQGRQLFSLPVCCADRPQQCRQVLWQRQGLLRPVPEPADPAHPQWPGVPLPLWRPAAHHTGAAPFAAAPSLLTCPQPHVLAAAAGSCRTPQQGRTARRFAPRSMPTTPRCRLCSLRRSCLAQMAYLALRQSKLSRSRRSNLDYAAKLFKCGCSPVCIYAPSWPQERAQLIRLMVANVLSDAWSALSAPRLQSPYSDGL
jgi:hypothetical protein